MRGIFFGLAPTGKKVTFRGVVIYLFDYRNIMDVAEVFSDYDFKMPSMDYKRKLSQDVTQVIEYFKNKTGLSKKQIVCLSFWMQGCPLALSHQVYALGMHIPLRLIFDIEMQSNMRSKQSLFAKPSCNYSEHSAAH